jgi:hypothetical protein
MTFSALPQLLVAVIGVLRGDATLMQAITGVYDEVPQSPVYPYVVVDDPFETPNRTFGQNGHDLTVTISIYARTPATTVAGSGKVGFLSALQIAEQAIALLADLEGHPIAIAGHDLVDADVLAVEAFRETDGKTRRVDITFTYTVETSP